MAEKTKRRNADRTQPGFDLEAAKKMAASFSGACDVRCRVWHLDGTVLYETGRADSDCAFCHKFQEYTGQSFDCRELHAHGARQAWRFGGRYIYTCPAGVAFFTAAIMAEGVLAGALVGGPVLMTDVEDFLENDAMRRNTLTPEQLSAIRMALLGVPEVGPRRLEHLSRQLFANAVYVGDSSHELFVVQRENARQDAMGDYIARLKDAPEKIPYPTQRETDLFSAISQGDRAAAANILNELLGYIFFYTDGNETIRTRITELLVVLSRAAIAGGANSEKILQLSQEYMLQMRRLNGQEELTRWLAESLNRYTNLVFDLLDVKHRNAMHRAIDYIKENYTRRITLQEVALHSGYSPAYFSRIFAQEIGVNFKEYVNELRIERSKALLLTRELTILEVGSMVGFSDQSYFCKIFKRTTGVSPDVFRKRVRRIDQSREYGLK